MAPLKEPEMAYADTNVFVGLFAAPDHALHEPALRLFRRVADGEISVILTAVIAAELAFVAMRVLGWTRGETADRLGSLLEAEGLVVPEGPTLRRAFELFADRRRLAFPDAYLAACALDTGPAAIASFDRALGAVPGVRLITS